jgi:hypothetical protein
MAGPWFQFRKTDQADEGLKRGAPGAISHVPARPLPRPNLRISNLYPSD